MKRKSIFYLVLLLCLATLFASCRWLQRSPERSPGRETQKETPKVAIPDPINQGEMVEPEISVYLAEENRIQTMKIEEYLQGVVAAEMEPEWPREALAAQAIIARSFTLQKISEDGGVPERNAHASTDIREFQAYDASRVNDNVRRAVESTRGLVAVYKNEFIRGWFHAYAGPRTATAPEGLEFDGPNPPYIQIVESPAEEIIPDEERNWRASFPLDLVRSATTEITGTDPGAVTKIEIAEKGPSGRVVRFLVNDVEVSGPQLRLKLGSTEMRSTFVEKIEIKDGEVVMEGVGYGHGVGMCQWGARALAEKGKTAEEIVKYYYKDIKIVKLWH